MNSAVTEGPAVILGSRGYEEGVVSPHRAARVDALLARLLEVDSVLKGWEPAFPDRSPQYLTCSSPSPDYVLIEPPLTGPGNRAGSRPPIA